MSHVLRQSRCQGTPIATVGTVHSSDRIQSILHANSGTEVAGPPVDSRKAIREGTPTTPPPFDMSNTYLVALSIMLYKVRPLSIA
jgi:hypothetical protein